MKNNNCLFCTDLTTRIINQNNSFFSIRDAYPISDGHTLIVSIRHIGSLFELTKDEWLDLNDMLIISKDNIKLEFNVNDMNVGINDGKLAGQTIPHFHLHLIPRFIDDCDDPRGGVRWIFPDKAKYWY